MQDKINVTVLISGRGSNLLALLQNQVHFRISAVLSDKSEAMGLCHANEAKIAVVESFVRQDFGSKIEQKKALYSRIRALRPDLICFAGFMQIIESDFVEEFYGKLINIHPSLLPDLSGLNTHRRAIEERRSEHGCTVHYIDAGVDTGPIIAQAKCLVLKSDSEGSLANKVLSLEHSLYPWVINSIASKNIWLDRTMQGRGQVMFSAEAKEQAKLLGFNL